MALSTARAGVRRMRAQGNSQRDPPAHDQQAHRSGVHRTPFDKRLVMRTAAIQNQPPTTLQRLTERFADLRARVRRRLATHPNAIQTTTGAELLDFRSPHPHWIVSRGLCMFRREDFSNVPRNKRRAAVELRVPGVEPVPPPRPPLRVVRRHRHGLVLGPRQGPHRRRTLRRPGHRRRRRAHRPRDRLPSHQVRTAPTCRPATKDSSCSAGATPSCRTPSGSRRARSSTIIAWFLARTGDAEAHAPEQNCAPAPAAPLLRDPWSSALSPREWFEVNETALVAAAVLLLAVALVWQETRVWKAHYIKAAAIEEFEHLQDTLAPELTARTELLDLRTQNRAIARILREPSQARLMAIVDGAVPSAEARFVAWRYQQGELRVVVEDPTPHPIAYVESFAAVPMFEDVQAAPERTAERLEITMRVAP